jgi:uncharacterized protein
VGACQLHPHIKTNINEEDDIVSNKGLVLFAGAAFGLMGALLVKSGNPGNMGYSAGCFLRDIAGALGWHKTATVQYLRPEILGICIRSLYHCVAER